jgi:DNA-binding MarR family transcriptional regulator
MASVSRQNPTTHQSAALIDHLARATRHQAEIALAPLGLRTRHLVALTLLRDHGPASQRDLAAALHLDPSNVVGLLNELERTGLAIRRRDADDRRRHIVELSRHGHETLAAAEQALKQMEDELFAPLDADQRETLYELLLEVTGGQLPNCVSAATDDGEPD